MSQANNAGVTSCSDIWPAPVYSTVLFFPTLGITLFLYLAILSRHSTADLLLLALSSAFNAYQACKSAVYCQGVCSSAVKCLKHEQNMTIVFRGRRFQRYLSRKCCPARARRSFTFFYARRRTETQAQRIHKAQRVFAEVHFCCGRAAEKCSAY